MKLAVVVLAAGESSRLGEPKQLIEIEGITLLKKQCLLATTTSPFAFCVLGFEDKKMRMQLPENVIEINNKHWKLGMSTSIKAAIEQIPSDTQGVLFYLVDQWKLDQSLLTQLENKWLENPQYIYAVGKEGAFGPPVIFPKKYFDELKKVDGKQGAKQVINNNLNDLITIEAQQAFEDIDTQEQLENVRSELATANK